MKIFYENRDDGGVSYLINSITIENNLRKGSDFVLYNNLSKKEKIGIMDIRFLDGYSNTSLLEDYIIDKNSTAFPMPFNIIIEKNKKYGIGYNKF